MRYRPAKSNARTRQSHGVRYFLFISASAITDFIGPSKTLVLISVLVRVRLVVGLAAFLGLATLAFFVVLVLFGLFALCGLLLLGWFRRPFVDAVRFAMNFPFHLICTKLPHLASVRLRAR